ncbi:GH92 family glycosyl hydrolase [Flavobacterium sp. FlaQc-57]|uniref:GH92 family glycosyl hydrolase n=1 Tax=Flavobacterium sp. FlaQc-57 TaxID=3374186 RepID=UPI00375687B7
MKIIVEYFLRAFVILLCGLNFLCAQETCYNPKQGRYTSLVNPLIGTAPLLDTRIIGYVPPANLEVWAGLVFPGSSLPNAMVQLSPVTEFGTGAGYKYEGKNIFGFAHTNKGHWDFCHIPILPVPDGGGSIAGSDHPFGSSFSHDQEKASPAYYEVCLKDYNVHVKLSSTLHCGIHEYTFKNNKKRKVLFYLGKANHGVDNWTIKQEGTNAVSGFQQTIGQKIYFYATLSSPIETIQLEKLGQNDGYSLVTIKDIDNKPVTLKIALSYVSVANAIENLNSEIGDKNFEEIFQEGSAVWENLLSKIQVKGGSAQQNIMFYSMLYRSFLWPALRSDVNGQFTDDSGKVRKENYRYYTLPSLWDDFRNKLVLLSIFSPDVTSDVISSMINTGDINGYIPTFFHGDHGASFIAGSYMRGIRNFDIAKAYRLLLNNAYLPGNEEPKDTRWKRGREYLEEYINKGFVPELYVSNPNTYTDNATSGVTKTLEYAYDDHALSLLAKELQDTEHYNDLVARSKNYVNVFDKSTTFMRGRLGNGAWVTPFNEELPYFKYMYREANAWHLSFYVPHDMQGLVNLYGASKFEDKLDLFFTKKWNPNYAFANLSGFIGQYCHGNQPDHEAPFSYYFINKPEKSQKFIDEILDTMYGIGDEKLAMCGMDDAGEMSSWYVFGALGLYPLSPADPEYIVTVPIFDEVLWITPSGKAVTIKNPNKKRSMEAIKVNSSKINSYFISHDLFLSGGEIEITTK